MSRIQGYALALLVCLMWASPSQAQSPCGSWSPVPVPGAVGKGLVSVGASSATDMWSVGEAVYHWNGSTWSRVPAPGFGNPDPNGYADTVFAGVASVSSNLAWIVGYTSFLGTPQTLVERWDGAKWQVLSSPVIAGGSGFDAVAALSATDAWAVGYRAGGLPDFQATRVTLTAHWNGSSWSAVPSPNVANRSHELNDVAAIASNDVWAVGYSRNMGEDYQTLVIHWNGTTWSIVPSFNYPGENILYGVSATSANDVWMVGSAWDGVTGKQIFLHWNGSSLNEVVGPGGATACAACTGDVLAMGTNDVWASGNNLGHWNGTSWSLVPNPNLPGSIGIALRSLVKVGACSAWAVGSSFCGDGSDNELSLHLTPGGGDVNQAPVALATGTPTSGYAPLTVQFNAAGSFDPDGSIVSYLWNFGDSSYPPNRYDANPVHTYIQTGPLVYYATLEIVDNRGAIAQTNVRIDITTGEVLGVGDEPPALRIVEVKPNPTRGRAAVTFELSSEAPATLKLFDLGGRLVVTLADGVVGIGRHESLLGMGSPAMPPPGIYFLQLSSGGTTSSVKLVVLD